MGKKINQLNRPGIMLNQSNFLIRCKGPGVLVTAGYCNSL